MEEQSVTTESATPATPQRGGLLSILLLAAGLLVGGVSGALVAGPLLNKGVRLAERSHPEATRTADREGDTAAAAADGEDEADEGASMEYRVEDLVLNPAGTRGTRFLMASVAFRLSDAATAEKMKARDSELRHEILQVLSSKTIADVTAGDSSRTAIAGEIRDSVAKVFGPKSVRAVFLPKFVTQ